MSRRAPATIVALALLVLAGCDVFGLGDESEPDLRLVALEEAVPAGGMQGIRTENHTSRSIFFNPCPWFFERRIGVAWVPLPETQPVACTQQLEELPAGTNAGFLIPVPESLTAGTYRIVFESFWFENGVSQAGTLLLDFLPIEERTSGRFEVVEDLSALSIPR
jgi:hypothetical protein